MRGRHVSIAVALLVALALLSPTAGHAAPRRRPTATATGTGWRPGWIAAGTARVAAATAADVLARWWSMAGRHGVGLQGGRFFTIGGAFTSDRPVARWNLHEVRWVRDVAVSGP